MPIPLIDDRVKFAGISALRTFNAKSLRELRDILVLQVEDPTKVKRPEPVAVLIPYDIYLEIQKALWPSSLLPSLESVFGPAALAQEEDARAVDLSSAPTHLVHRLRTTDDEPLCDNYTQGEPYSEAADRTNITCPACLSLDEERPLKYAPDVPVTIIGVTPEPRGGKFARVDDSAPPVFDDIDEVVPEERGAKAAIRKVAAEFDQAIADIAGVCAHCGKPNPSPLCQECFMGGHRNGSCLKCEEAVTLEMER